MIGTYYISTKVIKFTKNYILGWDVTDLHNKDNFIIQYLHKRYDEFLVLIILACISAVFNIILGLFCGTIGEIISCADMLLSLISTYFLVKECEGL